MNPTPNNTPNTCTPCALLFQPEARLLATRQRLAEADTLLATLDRTHCQAAERNAAVSATGFGEAWHNVNARANVARNFTVRELDALLDGDMDEADTCRQIWRAVNLAIASEMDAFEGELERFFSEN
jgi:hypothetical protein